MTGSLRDGFGVAYPGNDNWTDMTSNRQAIPAASTQIPFNNDVQHFVLQLDAGSSPLTIALGLVSGLTYQSGFTIPAGGSYEYKGRNLRGITVIGPASPTGSLNLLAN